MPRTIEELRAENDTLRTERDEKQALRKLELENLKLRADIAALDSTEPGVIAFVDAGGLDD